MKKPISFGSIGFELVSSLEETKAVPEAGDPFRICVLGDFTGRESRGVSESLKGRRPVLVDRDNLDDVIEKLGPAVVLEVLGQKIEPSFDNMDAFHPDELFNRLELFRSLRDTRRKLGDPRTYNAALKELRLLIGAGEDAAEPGGKPHGKPASSGGSLLDSIVDETREGTLTGSGTPGKGDLADFVEAIVKPYRMAPPDPSEDRLKAALDLYISVLMAEVLHHGALQEIEAAWRGLRFLVFRAETDEDLEIRLLDVSREELANDLLSTDDLAGTGLYRLFVKEPLASEDGKPWALLAGCYAFGHEDAEVLGRMAKIAAAAGAPFIAGAHPRLIGCESFSDAPDPAAWRYAPDTEAADAWALLRGLPEAAYLGLAAPRFLLRLPYGRDTDPVDVFDFEEAATALAHEHYLWGCPAFACAHLLAAAFSREGWPMTPGSVRDIDGLPLHSLQIDGETAIKPCAEILLTDKALETFLERGIMPLASMKNRDVARLVRFQSLAHPAARLSGRWDSAS
jgi:type VI secretion system protein ImpC